MVAAAAGGGGGGGGGLSHAPLTMEAVDITDGSWTPLVKDGWSISSVAYTAGKTGTYTLGALASGDVKYTPDGASFPIYYKQATATDSDGSSVLLTTDSFFDLAVRLSDYQASWDFEAYLMLGLTDDPTSVVVNDFEMVAASIRDRTTGAANQQGRRAVVVDKNVETVVGDTDSRHFFATIRYIGGTYNRVLNVNSYGIDGSDGFDAYNHRLCNKTKTAGQPLYVFVGVATNDASETVTAGDVVSGKLEWSALRWK
jgi:hypothetical protein